MKGASCPWSAKGRNHRDPSPTIGSQVHKLEDAPPYDSIRMTSHGIEALRSEPEKFRTMDSWGAQSHYWSAKGGNHPDPNPTIGSQVHKLKDVPPYDSIHMTSHGIEAVRSEPEKFRTMDSWRDPESEYTGYRNRSLHEEDVRAEYTRDSRNKVYDEDINAEAEEFIQDEHQKLKLQKWVSTNSFSY